MIHIFYSKFKYQEDLNLLKNAPFWDDVCKTHHAESFIHRQLKINMYMNCTGGVHCHNKHVFISQDYYVLILGVHILMWGIFFIIL